jgi:thiosulfate/3-mercaptopyruvate sulfurtransferase
MDWFKKLVGGTKAKTVSPAEFKQWLEEQRKVMILDVQPAGDFERHHIKGSVGTGPDAGRIDALVPTIRESQKDVVIVCPRGGGGARSAHDYLQGKGISAERLFILEGGMQAWPFEEMVEKGKAG